jgi:hypothetical protein
VISSTNITVAEAPQVYEDNLRQYERDIRKHHSVEQQLQQHIDDEKDKYDII